MIILSIKEINDYYHLIIWNQENSWALNHPNTACNTCISPFSQLLQCTLLWNQAYLMSIKTIAIGFIYQPQEISLPFMQIYIVQFRRSAKYLQTSEPIRLTDSNLSILFKILFIYQEYNIHLYLSRWNSIINHFWAM